MTTINSGGGSQTAAKVNSEGGLFVKADMRGDKMQEILRGWGFVLVDATVTPTGAGDCFFYVENASADPLVIDFIQFESAAAEDVYLEVSAAYTLGGTSAVPDAAQNRLVGSANAFTTKGVSESGVDITGIVGGVEVARFETAAGGMNRLDEQDAPLPIVLGQGQALSIFAGTGTAAMTHVQVGCYWIMTPNVEG